MIQLPFSPVTIFEQGRIIGSAIYNTNDNITKVKFAYSIGVITENEYVGFMENAIASISVLSSQFDHVIRATTGKDMNLALYYSVFLN